MTSLDQVLMTSTTESATTEDLLDSLSSSNAAIEPIEQRSNVSTGIQQQQAQNHNQQNNEGQGKRIKSKRGKKHALQIESRQMMNVLRHPSFRKDPTAAIKQHIKMTCKTL